MLAHEAAPEVKPASRLRRSAHTPAGRGGGWIRPSTRWAIYSRDDMKCVYCARPDQPLTLDHVDAVMRSGRDNSPRNLLTCCLSCNSTKQALSMRQWFASLREQGFDTETIRRRIEKSRRRKIHREDGRFLHRVQSVFWRRWLAGGRA